MGDTKEAILTTALQLFAGNGYEAVSVSEIAGALGMTKGALYKHYKNKRDIFDHILIRMEQRDAEQAGNCEMPEGTLEEMEEQYQDISMEQFFTYCKEQFTYWTEDTFAASFRRMLTLEQFRSEEMQKLYQQYLVAGPMEYVADLFTSSGVRNARAQAVRLYATMFFFYSVYDGAEDKESAKKQFQEALKELEKWKAWNDIRISTQNDIRVLARNGIDIIPFKEENHYSIYKIKKNSRVDCLLVVVHLLSKKSKSNEAQYNRANHIARELNKYEQEIFKSMEKRTIIVGDFNMQPYEAGICSGYGFNATMSANHAAKITREVDGEIVYFYYNPMWSLMGANKLVQGTYYNSSDKDDHAIYWYSFDSVLLRPCYIEKFSWNYFEIVEKTKKYNFVPNTTIDKERFSDHLPIKFEILGG